MVSVDVKHHVYLLASCSKVLKIVEAVISTSVICLLVSRATTDTKLQATAAIFIGYVSFQTSLCPRFCSSSVIISNSLFAFSSSWQWMTEEVSTESGGWRPRLPVRVTWVPAESRLLLLQSQLSRSVPFHDSAQYVYYVGHNLATALCLLCTVQLISNYSATSKQR